MLHIYIYIFMDHPIWHLEIWPLCAIIRTASGTSLLQNQNSSSWLAQIDSRAGNHLGVLSSQKKSRGNSIRKIIHDIPRDHVGPSLDQALGTSSFTSGAAGAGVGAGGAGVAAGGVVEVAAAAYQVHHGVNGSMERWEIILSKHSHP